MIGLILMGKWPYSYMIAGLIAATASLFSSDSLRTPYPAIEPCRIGELDVGKGHKLYWEESGNSKGIPVLFLHGGPGLGTKPSNRSFFNPEKYRIILFDQRGSGKSTPRMSIENNTTWDLISDIEQLRTLLEVDSWVLFGGSWGSTLALSYAIQHPERVTALILRGIFLCRPSEIHWFYQAGANQLFPDHWEQFLAPIPLNERENLVEAYYKRLTGDDMNAREECARAWATWEGRTAALLPSSKQVEQMPLERAYAMARIECHYFANNSFFPSENWILENIHRIRHIPCTMIQGRYDVICPLTTAWNLHTAWPETVLQIIPNAGHSASEPAITDALLKATDNLYLTWFKNWPIGGIESGRKSIGTEGGAVSGGNTAPLCSNRSTAAFVPAYWPIFEPR